jgi:hypothetical protein
MRDVFETDASSSARQRFIQLAVLVVCGSCLTPATAAARAHTRTPTPPPVYVAVDQGCSETVNPTDAEIKPTNVELECIQGAQTSWQSFTAARYRNYGQATAEATGAATLCIQVPAAGKLPTTSELPPLREPLPAGTDWTRCPLGAPVERSNEPGFLDYTKSYPAKFRFSNIVLCRGLRGFDRYRSRLFYSKISRSIAGKPWETELDFPHEKEGKPPAFGRTRCRSISQR